MTMNMVKTNRKANGKVSLKAKDKVLGFFFLNDQKEVYINELARIIDSDPKNVHRILVGLEQGGILESRFKGKERYFCPRRSDPLYKSARTVFMRTKGVEPVLKGLLKGFEGIGSALIYGSYANGAFSPSSDIDLLVVGEYDRLGLQRALYKLQRNIGREINVVGMKKAEFDKKKREGNTFIRSVLDGKVIKII
jgi:predicted nucleotidyltransferase